MKMQLTKLIIDLNIISQVLSLSSIVSVLSITTDANINMAGELKKSNMLTVALKTLIYELEKRTSRTRGPNIRKKQAFVVENIYAVKYRSKNVYKKAHKTSVLLYGVL